MGVSGVAAGADRWLHGRVKVSYDAARTADRAGQTVWAVPQIYEQECEHPGIVEHISYETKAYATDERTVEKQACVYLPYGYDPEKQYNILDRKSTRLNSSH